MDSIKYRQAGEMKDSEYVWLGEVPKEYRMSSLRHILREAIVDGPHETPDYVDEGIPFISVDSLDDRVNVNLDIVNRFITEKKYKEYNRKTRLTPNDILFSKSATIGKVAIVDGRKFMTWSPLAIIKSDESKVFYKLLYYILSSDKYLYQVISLSNLNTQFNIGMKTLEKSKIILPYDLNEQQRIANFLDIKTAQFDSIIAKKKLLIQKLEEAKKSLISEVVTGKVKIVDGKMVPRQPEEMKDSGIEWLGMIPKDWEIKKFSYLVRITNGLVNPTINPYSDMILIAPNHIASEKGRIIQLQTSQEQGADSGKYLCNVGDVLYSKIRPNLSKACIAPIRCMCSADMYPMKADNSRLTQEFLLWILLSNNFTKFVVLESDRVAMPKVNRESLSRFRLPIPPIGEQIILNQFMKNKDIELENTIDKINSQIQKLKQAKQSLISEAVTGKIDLRDWETIEEGGVQ